MISRFIVRMNQYISKQTYWRTGVVLTYQNDSNKALIKADIEDKKIFIWVDGNDKTKRNLLAIIRRDFEHIHNTIKGLKIFEKVPYKNVILDYQDLIDLENMHEEFITIPSLKEKVLVKTLLDGIESERKEIAKPEINKEIKPDNKAEEKTDYAQLLYAAITGAIIGFALIFLIGKLYYGMETNETLTILKETFSPFAQTYKELTNSEDEKENKK